VRSGVSGSSITRSLLGRMVVLSGLWPSVLGTEGNVNLLLKNFGAGKYCW